MREFKLHTAWKQSGFAGRKLHTLCGEELLVIDTGSPNTGDGPDFRNAVFRTESGLHLCGDVEIHIQEKEWEEHGHHTDPAYNATVVHLLLHSGRRRMHTASGHRPYVVSMMPYLASSQLSGTPATFGLPCSGLVRYLNENVVRAQFEKARQEYFAGRVEALTAWWPAGKSIGDSWKSVLVGGLADGLGISHNRAPMRRLALECWSALHENRLSGAEAVAGLLRSRSGLFGKPGLLSRQEWDLSGPRPENKPEVRINQLADLLYHLQCMPVKELLRQPGQGWQQLAGEHAGTSRFNLLYFVVWLPAVYLLGTVLQARTLQAYAWNAWEEQHIAPPASVSEPFREAGIGPEARGRHLGAVHQLKSYCRAGRCGACKIGRESLSPDEIRTG